MNERVATFSAPALAILNAMPADPDATYAYEHLSGGFVWSDELPDIRSADWKIVRHDYIYRFLINLRRCITLGDASLESTPLWQQMVNDAPAWPGLLPERRTGNVAKRLLATERLAHRSYERMDDECEGNT
jgi:hypothetical protein